MNFSLLNFDNKKWDSIKICHTTFDNQVFCSLIKKDIVKNYKTDFMYFSFEQELSLLTNNSYKTNSKVHDGFPLNIHVYFKNEEILNRQIAMLTFYFVNLNSYLKKNLLIKIPRFYELK